MADKDLKVRATLDAQSLTSDLQRIGNDMDAALDKATASADKLGSSLSKVEQSAKLTAGQIRSMAAAFSGMALQVGGAYLEARGQDSAAGYLKAAGSGALQGAATGGMAFGAPGAVAGAGIGAVAGAGSEYFRQEARARQAEESLQELARSNVKALAEYERLKTAADESSAFFRRMGDETLTLGERTQQLNERMRAYRSTADELRSTLSDSGIQRDGKAFAETLREYARIGQEISKLESVRSSLAEQPSISSADIDPRVRMQTGALQRLGIGVGGDELNSLAQISREGNTILKSIDNTMRAISVRGNVPVWT